MSSADSSIKILLVDEDADYLNLTKRILDTMSEFSVETTPDPAEALKIIDEIPVDAVVSYYQVSKISGLEFLRRVRERYNDLPFILLTDENSKDVAVEALRLGADFFLQKDFNQLQVTELSNMVRQIVKLRRVEKNLQDKIIYKSILDSSPVAITINVEGKIVYANQKRAELTGHQFPQELVGVDSLQMVHPDDLEAIRNPKWRGDGAKD